MTLPTDPTLLKLQAGSTGTTFKALIVDEQNAPVDVTGFDTAEFRFKKPQTTGLVLKAATAPGTPVNLIQWKIPQNATDFLDVYGVWSAQAHVVKGDTYWGQVLLFEVLPNLA